MAAVTFGGNHHDRLEISVAGYERPGDNNNYHDANWLSVQVNVAVGGFRGGFNAAFLTAELEDLCTKLKDLYASLKGSTKWETMEGQLRLAFLGNGLGGIELQGDARDQAGIGNHLSFKLDLDQTQLAQSISQLDGLMSAFPIRDV
jgi:hypothetical protein